MTVPVRGRIVRSAAPALFALLLAACGSTAPTPTVESGTTSPSSSSSASPDASPTAPPADPASPSTGGAGGRTGRVDVPAAGIALTLPEGWVEIPFDEAALAAMIAGLPSDSPYRDMLEAQGQALAGGLINLLAFDLADQAPETAGSNLSVIAQAVEIPPSLLATVVRSSLSQLPKVQGEPVLSDVTIDGVDAIRADFTLEEEVAALEAPITLEATQVYVSAGGRFVVLTLGIRAGADDVRDEVIASIRLLD